jgi:hypothetical protein
MLSFLPQTNRNIGRIILKITKIMNNNQNMEIIKPLIFTKKLNDNHKIIPLNITGNTLGPTRHFPPATKEWFNSIYAYNNNSLKNLSIADKNLSKLIKSYFNLYFSKNVLKSRRIATRFRRLSLNKIFISKAELKHTSSKVIITLYIYNEEKRLLGRRLKRLAALLLPSANLSYFSQLNKNTPLSINKKLSLIEKQKERIPLINYLEELKLSIIELKLEQEKLVSTNNLKLLEEKQLFITSLESSLDNLSNTINICKNDVIIYDKCDKIYEETLRKIHLEKEIAAIAYYKLLLNLNRSKFEDKFLLKLKPLISKIYNKEVEFNIVNLKTLYLNSDIFTQAIAIKLKNRENRLLTVLRSSLHMVKLPNVNSIREKYGNVNIKQLWVNKVNNLQVNSVMGKYKTNEDTLNQLLLDMFSNSSVTEKVGRETSLSPTLIAQSNIKANTSSTIQDIVLNSLKHKSMAGARLEAKGRLTRRFTASRSVFKVKWKGSIKNIDSSYRGLSSVILRGHLKSNVQYSVVNSKTRNGAFGLKGWISSK